MTFISKSDYNLTYFTFLLSKIDSNINGIPDESVSGSKLISFIIIRVLSDKIAKSKYPNISKCIGNDGNLTWTTAIGGGISFLESGDKFKVLPFTKQI